MAVRSVRVAWKPLAVAVAAVVSLFGVIAGPVAQASQHSHSPIASSSPYPRAGVVQSGLQRPGLLKPGDTSDLFSRTPDGLFASSPWRHGLLARGGLLPHAARKARSAVPAVSAARGWRVQRSPNVVRLRNGTPVAESCSSREACTAVGTYENKSGAIVPLAERWNGWKWHIQAMRTPAGAVETQLTGVSCPAERDCMAVGYYFTAAGDVLPVAETWTGARWQIHTTPRMFSPGYGFFAVSCTAAIACTAVGTAEVAGLDEALAERWDGQKWTVQSTPMSSTVPSTLLGVSCSGATACTSVGATDNSSGTSVPLALAWDGATWSSQAIPGPAGSPGSGLYAVSCFSAAACVATGSLENSSGATYNLAYGWNGMSWTRQAVPGPKGAEGSQLFAVSCASATSCLAVGSFLTAPSKGGAGGGAARALGELWNGTRWLLRRAGNPAGSIDGALEAVTCTAASACSSVGFYENSTDPAVLTLAERWNGSAWKVQSSTNQVGANENELAADSCSASRACLAVGYYVRTFDIVDTLAEFWNGSAWRIVRTPNPRSSVNSDLFAVSCPANRACVAVGGQATRNDKVTPLAEAWNGSRWVIQRVAVPAHATYIVLYAVSCSSARACVAVGSYGNRAGGESGLAERWNGTRWRIQAVPHPQKYTYLQGVSCQQANICEAVGYMVRQTGNAHPIAARWTGSRWRVQRVPLPRKSPGGILSAVSCTPGHGCTATGAGFASNGTPLAERWNGVRWHPMTTLAPPGYQYSTSEIALTSVSCSAARACTAVGTYTPENLVESFAEAWNGTKWKRESIALPASAVESVMGGVSCLPHRCTAVGAAIGVSGSSLTLVDTKRI